MVQQQKYTSTNKSSICNDIRQARNREEEEVIDTTIQQQEMTEKETQTEQKKFYSHH